MTEEEKRRRAGEGRQLQQQRTPVISPGKSGKPFPGSFQAYQQVSGKFALFGSLPVTASDNMNKLQEQLLTGTAASITFSGIVAGYAQLLLYYMVRDNTAGSLIDVVQLQFNGDTGANYDYTIADDSNTEASSETFAATSIRAGLAQQASAPANVATVGRIWIPEYAGTTFNKAGLAEYATKYGTSAGLLRYERSSFYWRSSNAITSITLTPASGSFISGCAFRLYGIS